MPEGKERKYRQTEEKKPACEDSGKDLGEREAVRQAKELGGK
jgi:hypothetical protein